MSRKQNKEKAPEIPVAVLKNAQVFDESADCQKSMLACGWHNNYADFEADGLKGTVVFYGDKLFIEVNRFTKEGSLNPKAKRYRVCLKALIEELVDKAKEEA